MDVPCLEYALRCEYTLFSTCRGMGEWNRGIGNTSSGAQLDPVQAVPLVTKLCLEGQVTC